MRGCIGASHVGGEGGLSRFLHVWDDLADPEHDYLVDWGEAAGVREVLVGEMQSPSFPLGGLQGKRGVDPQGLQTMTLGLIARANRSFEGRFMILTATRTVSAQTRQDAYRFHAKVENCSMREE